jgi:hypothetical protein
MREATYLTPSEKSVQHVSEGSMAVLPIATLSSGSAKLYFHSQHSKAFPRFQTKRYASGNDLFLFSVFCRIPGKTGNTGAEKLRGRTHPLTHGVYLLYRRFLDSSTNSYGEEKPNRYSTNNNQVIGRFPIQ